MKKLSLVIFLILTFFAQIVFASSKDDVSREANGVSTSASVHNNDYVGFAVSDKGKGVYVLNDSVLIYCVDGTCKKAFEF